MPCVEEVSRIFKIELNIVNVCGYIRLVMSLSNDSNFVKPGAHRPAAGMHLVS